MIQLLVNGQPQHLDATISVSELLRNMGLEGKRLAIDRNGEIVPRSKFDEQMLIDGDRLEIVTAIGGG